MKTKQNKPYDYSQIEEALQEALSDQDNAEKKIKLQASIADFLKRNKVTKELLSYIFKGFDIDDNGSAFMEYLQETDDKKRAAVCKLIEGHPEVKNASAGAVKCLAELMRAYVSKELVLDTSGDSILNALNQAIKKAGEENEKNCDAIMRQYFIDGFFQGFKYPKWTEISNSPEAIQLFADYILGLLGSDQLKPSIHELKRWLNEGKKEAGRLQDVNAIENQIPKSRIEDLRGILSDYEALEEKFRDSVYANAELKKKLKNAEDNFKELELEKSELTSKISSLNDEIGAMKEKLTNAGKELGERKKLNEVQTQYREEAKESMLQDIGRSLRAEFDDFVATENDEMSIPLGEIYREKLHNILKTLEKKGIKV